MSKNENVKFTCRECGAHELGYQKYAKCISPVFLQENGNMEYGSSAIDEDDYLATLNGFACRSCGSLIKHCGCTMGTEKQLLDYFAMDPQIREQQQQEYEALMSDHAYDQERKEKEQADVSALLEL